MEEQISIVDVSQLSRRVDAEYYQPKLLEYANALDGIGWPIVMIGDLVKSGYRVVYTNTKVLDEKYNPKKHVRFLQAADVSSSYPSINEDSIRWVTKDDWNAYPNGRIQHGEILIEVKGKAEKVVLVPDDFPLDMLVTGTLYKMQIDESKIDRHFVFIYLLSQIGKKFRDRGKTNTLISYVSKDELYTIPIPIPHNNFQQNIAALYKRSYKLFQKSKQLYINAEELLLNTLGLDKFDLSFKQTYTQMFAEFIQAERLDAEYFQPKYDEIIGTIKNYKKWDVLGNLVRLEKCIEVGSKAYLAEGIPFLRVSDLGIFELDEEKYISKKLYKKHQQHQPEKGEILLSKDATPGIAHYLWDEPQKMIPSGGILRLSCWNDVINGACLTLILNSIIGQEQMTRDVGGSVILHWRPDQIEKIKIPILPKRLQFILYDQLKKSVTLRKKSNFLLDCAKKGVEMVIEENEESASTWLDSQFRD